MPFQIGELHAVLQPEDLKTFDTFLQKHRKRLSPQLTPTRWPPPAAFCNAEIENRRPSGKFTFAKIPHSGEGRPVRGHALDRHVKK
jgi:hypothetical protein